MLKLFVSKSEEALLQDIEELGFGEILNVNHNDEPRVRVCTVSPAIVNFLDALRGDGHFDKLTIHDGQPFGAERSITTEGGHKAIKRYRFDLIS